MKSIYLLLITLLLLACQNQEPPFGIATNYLPESTLLQKGVVNKYYSHHKKKDSYDTSTDIRYDTYEWEGENKLLQRFYNPAYDLEVSKKYLFNDNQMSLVAEKRFFQKDTFNVEIDKGLLLDWEKAIGQTEKKIEFDWGTRKWIRTQKVIKDTIVLNKPAKIFTGTLSYTQVYKGDTTNTNSIYKEIYVQDLGLFSRTYEDDESNSRLELVEQIPLAAFQKSARHTRKRVAYINPDKTLDKNTTFKTCGINNWIYDYYNGQEDYHYQGGKKEIWTIVKSKLDESQLLQESGYLTFRFVVNCKGQAGYFIIEQADLDFQKKTFNEATVKHLYEITKTLEGWNPTQIRKESVDAYFYLTYKLKDGKLIDLLP